MYLTLHGALSLGAAIFCAGCLLQCCIDYYLLSKLEKIVSKELGENANNR